MNFQILEARHFSSPEASAPARVVKDYEIDLELGQNRLYRYDRLGELRLSRGDVLIRTPGGVVSATGKQESYLLTLDFSNKVSREAYS